MSYDVHFTIDTGGEEPATVGDYDLNYTYNCAPMFRLALGGQGLRDLHGMRTADAIPRLEAAVAAMRDPEKKETYEALNPKNGWGNHESATNFIANILEAAMEHQKTTIVVT